MKALFFGTSWGYLFSKSFLHCCWEKNCVYIRDLFVLGLSLPKNDLFKITSPPAKIESLIVIVVYEHLAWSDTPHCYSIPSKRSWSQWNFAFCLPVEPIFFLCLTKEITAYINGNRYISLSRWHSYWAIYHGIIFREHFQWGIIYFSRSLFSLRDQWNVLQEKWKIVG